MKTKITTLLFIIISTVFSTVSATTYTAVASTGWNVTTTWSPNGTPTVADDVIIPSGFAVTAPTANAICKTLTIDAAGSLDFGTAAFTLTVGASGQTGDAMIVAGTFNGSSAAAGTVTVYGNIAMSGAGVFQNNNTANNTVVAVAGDINLTGTSTFKSGSTGTGAGYLIAWNVNVGSGCFLQGFKRFQVGSGTSPYVAKFVNNGTVNNLHLRIHGNAASLTVSGSGASNFLTISSFDTSTTKSQEIVLNGTNMNITTSCGLQNFTANAGQIRTMTIGAGAVLTLASTATFGSLVLNHGTYGKENWVYNINGTVDATSGAKIGFGTNVNAGAPTNQTLTINVGSTGVIRAGSYIYKGLGQAGHKLTVNVAPGAEISYTGTSYTTNQEAVGATAIILGNSLLTSANNQNLKFTAATDVTLAGDSTISVSGTLTNTPKLILGTANLTIKSGGSIASPSATNYIVENSTGKLTLYCPASTATLFPIGSSATVYTPATITANANANISAITTNAFTNAVNNASLTNSTQWKITPDATVNATFALTPESNTNNSTPVVGYYSGGVWSEQAAAYASGTFITDAAIATTANNPIYLGTGSANAFASAGAVSADATLSDIKINGTTISLFDPATLTYNYKMTDRSSTTVPTITYSKSNANASVVQTNATAIPGTTTLEVTAQDGTTKLSYTININYNYGIDATLSDLKANGTTVSGFASATTAYTLWLPAGTNTVPVVTATSTDAYAKSVVVTPATAVPGTATIVVTADDNTTTKTYTINFKLPTTILKTSTTNLDIYNQYSTKSGTITIASDGAINSTQSNGYVEIPVTPEFGGSFTVNSNISTTKDNAQVNVAVYESGTTFAIDAAKSVVLTNTGDWASYLLYNWTGYNMNTGVTYLLRMTFLNGSPWVGNVQNISMFQTLFTNNQINTDRKITVNTRNNQVFVNGVLTDETISIYNTTGCLISQKQANNSTETFHLNNGLYLIKVGNTFVQKAIVK